jgi:hypothetical protein
VQAERAESPPRNAIVHVPELGLPTAQEFLALHDRNDVLHGPQNGTVKER